MDNTVSLSLTIDQIMYLESMCEDCISHGIDIHTARAIIDCHDVLDSAKEKYYKEHPEEDTPF